MDVAIFKLLMLVLFSPAYTLEGVNICSKNVTTESGELEAKKICCIDFEEKHDKCVECSPGFVGWNCTERCPKNYYGRKCWSKCSCDETQVCHPVCGCLQRLDLDNSNMTNNGTSIVLENVTSSPFAEECTITKGVLSDSTTTECRVHHNMVYDLGDTSRIRENPSVREEPAEPLYGECSYEEACYSILVLRVDNESRREPKTSRQPVFTDDDNIYEFAQRYTHHSDEGQPPNVYITDLTEAAE